MSLPIRYAFYIFCLCVCITILSFHLHREDPELIRWRPNISTKPITMVGNRTFIIAPYYDPRGKQAVRVLSIVHVSVTELFCLFYCSHSQMVLVKGQTDIHHDRFGFPYGMADILCLQPTECDYNYISIQESNSTSRGDMAMFKVRNQPAQSYTVNFTVCISAVFGQYNNVLQIIQSLEMYRLLGASRVTLYNTSCSRDVDKVLRYYSQQGFLEVIQWPIDQHLLTAPKWRYMEGLKSQISYYGQTATLNDCIYRNMYKSKYVLLNDLDEVILPVKHWGWTSLMEDLQKQFPNTNVFRVENHIFPIMTNGSGFDLWTDVPGTNILNHPFREPIDWNRFNGRKLIVNPRQVYQTSVHSVLKHGGNSRNVGQNMAITFHCRKSMRKNIIQEDLIEDQTLRRYNLTLVPNVHKVINHLFPKD